MPGGWIARLPPGKYSAGIYGGRGLQWQSRRSEPENRPLNRRSCRSKQFGKGAIMSWRRVGEGEDSGDIDGSISLNIALGIGGYFGRVTEIFGPESSGKTTLTLQVIAEAQEGGIAALSRQHALDRTTRASGREHGRIRFPARHWRGGLEITRPCGSVRLISSSSTPWRHWCPGGESRARAGDSQFRGPLKPRSGNLPVSCQSLHQRHSL